VLFPCHEYLKALAPYIYVAASILLRFAILTVYRVHGTNPISENQHFLFWGGLSKMCSPRRAGKRPPKIVKIQKCLDLIGDTMVLPLSTYKIDAKNIPDTFRPVPDLF